MRDSAFMYFFGHHYKARASTPNNMSLLAPPHSASRQYSVNSAAISSQMTSLFMSSQHSMLLTPRSGYYCFISILKLIFEAELDLHLHIIQ